MVLLKNEGLLPLKKNIKKLAVIGPNAKNAQIIGGGSASLMPHYQVQPLEAFKARLSAEVNIEYAKGCHTHKYLPRLNENLISGNKGFVVEYFNGQSFEENLIFSEHLIGNKFWVFEGFAKEVIGKEERPNISVKFSCDYNPDISGDHEFEIFGIGQCKLLIDGKELIDNWNKIEPGEAFFTFSSASKKGIVDMQKGGSYHIEVQYYFEGNFPAVYIGCQAPDEVDLFQQAIEVASNADQVILIAGTNSDWETEGNDRAELGLPADQDALIKAILEANKNTTVIINTGSPVEMSWIDNADAVIQTWFAGQEFGNALVDIVTGEINPSGRLPTTFPKNITDTPAYDCYPGEDQQMNYEEKLLVGYRWYDKKGNDPLFSFGHGLSYTQFEYSNLAIKMHDSNEISCIFTIENIGDAIGAEVAQCYVAFENLDSDEPIKTLQGFAKETIAAGDKKTIEIKLTQRNFSYWDVESKCWKIRQGSYEILIGSSARLIHLTKTVSLEQVQEVLEPLV
jgi:beta-glucosidase